MRAIRIKVDDNLTKLIPQSIATKKISERAKRYDGAFLILGGLMLRIPRNLPYVRYEDTALETTDNDIPLLRDSPEDPVHIHSEDYGVERIFVYFGITGEYEKQSRQRLREIRRLPI
jgi:hypothetical protein